MKKKKSKGGPRGEFGNRFEPFNKEDCYPWTFESFISGAIIGALLVYIFM